MVNPYAPPGSRPPGSPLSPPPPARPPARPPLDPADRRSPRRPPVDPEKGLEALVRCGRFALLVLAGLAVLPIGLPWQATSLVFFIAGMVAGVRALVASRRAGITGGVVVALALGLVAVALLILVEAALVATWDVTADTQRCQQQALTVQATDACTASTTARLESLTGR